MRYDKQNKKFEALNEELQEQKNNNLRLNRELSETKEILNSTLHEIRRFSAQLSRFCEKINREAHDNHILSQAAQSAFYTAGMISSRLAYTDIELNPRAIENQNPIRSGIFKKFDKISRILAEEAKTRGVRVSFIGESRVELDALPVFELLPFVILETAIIYSPRDQLVELVFERPLKNQIVTIKSVGPDVSRHELTRIFEKGFRGASTVNMPGEGLGLFLAKRVCEFHSISISAEVKNRNKYELNGIKYSDFSIQLEF
jgi:signal transduction histidine kinase